MYLTVNSVLILIVCNFLLLLVWLWFRDNRNFWAKQNIHTPPYSLLWGHTETLFLGAAPLPDRLMMMYKYFKERGLKCGGLFDLFEPILVVVDLNLIKLITQKDFQYFTDRPDLYVKKEPLTANLLALKGDQWKQMRNKITPTFSGGKTKLVFDKILTTCDELMEILELKMGASIELKNILKRFSIGIIKKCAFGMKNASIESDDDKFYDYKTNCARKSGLWIFFYKILCKLNLTTIFNLRLIPKPATDFFLNLVKNAIKTRSGADPENDLLQTMLDIHNNKCNEISVNDIAAQVFIILLASSETVPSTIYFCLYELSKHKEIQDEVRKEINEVISKYEGKITYEAIAEMPYLDNVFHETLRMYPSGLMTRRTCTKDYRIPGTESIIKKDTFVLIPIIAVHYDSDYYKEPHKFDPERFTVDNAGERNENAFLGFGKGPRMCIAKHFGSVVTKVALVTLLRRYAFELDEKTVQPLRWQPQKPSLETVDGIWLTYKKISSFN